LTRTTLKERRERTNLSTRLSRSEQLAQAEALWQRRLFGASVPELAEEFGLSENTVSRRLKLAEGSGVPAHAREILIREGLPLAFAVAMETMRQQEDRKLAFAAAKMFIEGLEVMKTPAGSGDGSAGDGESYELYRERIRVVRTERPGDGVGASTGGDSRDTITVTPVPSGPAGRDAAPGAGAPEEFPFRRSGWGAGPATETD
jgi:hypothetical protein